MILHMSFISNMLHPSATPKEKKNKYHNIQIKHKDYPFTFSWYSIFFPVSSTEASESRGQFPYELNCGRKPFCKLHKIETDQIYEHAKSKTMQNQELICVCFFRQRAWARVLLREKQYDHYKPRHDPSLIC